MNPVKTIVPEIVSGFALRGVQKPATKSKPAPVVAPAIEAAVVTPVKATTQAHGGPVGAEAVIETSNALPLGKELEKQLHEALIPVLSAVYPNRDRIVATVINVVDSVVGIADLAGARRTLRIQQARIQELTADIEKMRSRMKLEKAI